MTNAVERVATALADFYDDSQHVGSYIVPARVAIEAMREPEQVSKLGEAIGKHHMGGSTFCAAANDNYPRIVAFTGLAGSGKSTATKYLVERHGYTLVKFAGPLKDMMRAIGLGEEQIEGGEKETPCSLLSGDTPRRAMQTLGTEWGRDCMGPDFWVNLWRARAVQHARVVVDDCRFPNEAEAIRQLGGKIIKLEGRGGIAGSHSSESGCGYQDAIVDNDGCITALYASVEETVRRLAA